MWLQTSHIRRSRRRSNAVEANLCLRLQTDFHLTSTGNRCTLFQPAVFSSPVTFSIPAETKEANTRELRECQVQKSQGQLQRHEESRKRTRQTEARGGRHLV